MSTRASREQAGAAEGHVASGRVEEPRAQGAQGAGAAVGRRRSPQPDHQPARTRLESGTGEFAEAVGVRGERVRPLHQRQPAGGGELQDRRPVRQQQPLGVHGPPVRTADRRAPDRGRGHRRGECCHRALAAVGQRDLLHRVPGPGAQPAAGQRGRHPCGVQAALERVRRDHHPRHAADSPAARRIATPATSRAHGSREPSAQRRPQWPPIEPPGVQTMNSRGARHHPARSRSRRGRHPRRHADRQRGHLRLLGRPPPAPRRRPRSSSAPANDFSSSPVRTDEKAVDSTLAATLTQKAEAKTGGAVYRVETDAGDATYEAHVTKGDGSLVTVKFDSSGNITAVEDGMGKGDPAPAGAPTP